MTKCALGLVYMWAVVCCWVHNIVLFLTHYMMKLPDKWVAWVAMMSRRRRKLTVCGHVDGVDCTNRLNILVWLYFDDGYGGLSINHLRLLPGHTLVFVVTSGVVGPDAKHKCMAINLQTGKYSDGEDIDFGEVVLV